MKSTATTQFEAIGTHWQIDLNEGGDAVTQQKIFALIRGRIELYESTYSRFRDGTLIDQMSAHAGTYKLPEDAHILFDTYHKLYGATGGSVTPLIGNTLVAAGYDKEYSLTKGILSPTPPWEEVLDYDFPTLHVKKPTQLDLGALGKGHLIDIVGEILEENDIHSYTIDAGGDIRYRTEDEGELVVGLEHPQNKTQVIGSIKIQNESICGSSGNRRTWSDMHHIIDPHTTKSPKDILAVWVVADTTLIADAMSTALFFTDPKMLNNEFLFDYLIMRDDQSITRSKGFTAHIFTATQ